MPEEIKVDVTIVRTSSSTQGDFMSLTFTDSDSRVQFLQVRMSLEDFARAVTSSVVPGQNAVVRGLTLVGTKQEGKTEFVPYASDGYCRHGSPPSPGEKEALKPFEKDGWKGRTEDLRNIHRRSNRNGVEGYTVHFIRHVPKGENG